MSSPTSTTGRSIRIGGASGFWGDSSIATPQLLQLPGLQFSETNCSLVPSENFPSFFALPISATCKTLRTHFPL